MTNKYYIFRNCFMKARKYIMNLTVFNSHFIRFSLFITDNISRKHLGAIADNLHEDVAEAKRGHVL